MQNVAKDSELLLVFAKSKEQTADELLVYQFACLSVPHYIFYVYLFSS